MFNSYRNNSLEYNKEKCINCGMCSMVCPHGVFTESNDTALLINSESCMECGHANLTVP